MAAMTRAGQETCSHEQCDMEPCTAFDYMSYEYDSVWGWATTCERCEGMFPGTLPEEHEEQHHDR